MRAAVLNESQRLEVTEISDPSPGPGELVLEVTACGICGSDLKLRPSMPAGIVMGHEFCGEIVATGTRRVRLKTPYGRLEIPRKEIERLFSPEFRNRLDEIVTFAPLGPEVMGRVVDKFVGEVEDQLRERKVALALTDAARSWLAEKGYDPAFGARPMARVIQSELTDRLVDDVLFGELSKRGGRVEVDLGADGRLVFRVIGSA